MNGRNDTIDLSLISHTNTGKTTLARTLLRQDVGEVLDRPHVTEFSAAYTMIETEGGVMRLWDTPGFGNTARLLRRLRLQGNPIGWILTQVWDRFADRPMWCSQQAVLNVKEEADVVLYLVNASEDPGSAAYVGMEMEILVWIGKPVLLLLNQTGLPRDPAESRSEEEKWQDHLRPYGVVREALSLDAFARCWVQEGVLLKAVGDQLPPEKKDLHKRLSQAWRERNLEVFHRSIRSLSLQLAQACCDREQLSRSAWLGDIPGISRMLDIRTPGQAAEKKRAMAALAERLDQNIRRGTDTLIELHGLQGKAAGEILSRLEEDYSTTQPVNEGISAVLGGLVTGALGGLAADIAAGGMTLGGGVLAGSILGALGAKGLARGYNIVRGEDVPFVRWAPEFCEGLVQPALLRYLAVAHHGRGRGAYAETERPRFWQDAAAQVVEQHRSRIRSILERGKGDINPASLAAEIEEPLTECAHDLLKHLYGE